MAHPIDTPQAPTAPPTAAPTASVPVSRRTLLDCLNSTRYWDKMLPEYANHMQRRADSWAIASGVLSALTGLGVWATLAKDTRGWAQVLVAAVALASAICALIPRVKNYGEMAGQAHQLQSSYGRLEGLLLDADLASPRTHDDADVRKLIVEFDTVKSSKDTSLRDMPPKPIDTRGRSVDKHGIESWPPDVYWQARAQQRRMRRSDSHTV